MLAEFVHCRFRRTCHLERFIEWSLEYQHSPPGTHPFGQGGPNEEVNITFRVCTYGFLVVSVPLSYRGVVFLSFFSLSFPLIRSHTGSSRPKSNAYHTRFFCFLLHDVISGEDGTHTHTHRHTHKSKHILLYCIYLSLPHPARRYTSPRALGFTILAEAWIVSKHTQLDGKRGSRVERKTWRKRKKK